MTLKLSKKILIVPLMAIVLIIMWQWNFDLRKDSQNIKTILLNDTPIGMSFDEVVSILQSKDIKLNISNNVGFYKQENGKNPSTIGFSSIRGFLGNYRVFPFFLTSVTAFWGFDKKGKLIEVWIWKTTDGF